MLVHVLLAAFAALAIANDKNYTLDDSDSALRYLPSTAWLQLSRPCAAPSCSWHQALPDSGAALQLSFVGRHPFISLASRLTSRSSLR